MLIEEIEKTGTADGLQELKAWVSWETPSPRRFRVYFRFRDAPGEIADSADPFVIGFLYAAMLLGEDLEVRGPIDPELIDRIETDIIPLLRSWYPFLHSVGFLNPQLVAPKRGDEQGGGAVAFSGGLDALYSAVRHLGKIDWLVAVQGFDVRSFRPEEWTKVLGDIRHAAAPLNRPLIEARTNLREVSHYHVLEGFDGRVRPEVYEFGPKGPIGPFLAALGRCLSPFCSRFFVSSDFSYDRLRRYGTHPLLDPMWSTKIQHIRHVGCEFNRIEKIGWLKENFPEVLAKMRVCLHPSPRRANCGKCEKCLRTLAEARIARAEACLTSFSEPLDLERIRQLDPGPIQGQFWEELAEYAMRCGDDELARAARVAIGRSFYLPRFLRTLRQGRSRPRSVRSDWRRLRKIMKPPKGNSAEAIDAGKLSASIAYRASDGQDSDPT